MAVAQQRGWNYGDHRSLKTAVRRLAAERDDPFLETVFRVPKRLHTNPHHKSMQHHESNRDRLAIRLFVQRLHSLMTSE